MKLTELATFDVAHEKLSWPWMAFDANRNHVAFATRAGSGATSDELRIATRRLDGGRIIDGPSFVLTADLALPTASPPDEAVRDATEGLHAFAVNPPATLLVATAVVAGASVLVSVDETGETRRTALASLAGDGFVGQALTFDRGGRHVWLSAESAIETAILRIDAASHAVVGAARSPALPPPAMHELHLHPHEDAVLLLAACGQDGTFARIARVAGETVEAEWSSLEGGSIPAGMVGFSTDGTRVYLAEADEIRVHGWPGLKELSSTPFEGDFVGSYSGAVIGERVLVDGEDAESNEDEVAVFDREATRASLALPPVPSGMWAGLLGTDVLVTVSAKGEPALARIVRVAF